MDQDVPLGMRLMGLYDLSQLTTMDKLEDAYGGEKEKKSIFKITSVLVYADTVQYHLNGYLV